MLNNSYLVYLFIPKTFTVIKCNRVHPQITKAYWEVYSQNVTNTFVVTIIKEQ